MPRQNFNPEKEIAMTHEDAGKYALKHKGKQVDENVRNLLQKKADNGNITCAAAHAAAKELDKTPEEVGIQADLMELRLIKCSNGLFGYEPDGKILKKGMTVSSQLAKKIEKTADNKSITCLECWEIAKSMKISKVDAASACDSKGIKIKKCQLGAF